MSIVDIIRIASRQTLKDAAFYVSFSLKRQNLEGNIYNILKISHGGASDSELKYAITESTNLENYCLGTPHDLIENDEDVAAFLNKTRDEHSGFSDETYNLIKWYIPTGEISSIENSEIEPEINLIANREWSDTPYFRRPIFLIILMLFFTPLFLIIIWTGDVYYRHNDTVYKMSMKTKKLLTMIAILPIATYFLRHIHW